MAVLQKGGAKNDTTVAGLTVPVSYTPTAAGNEILFCLNAAPTISGLTVKDQNGNALTAGPTLVIDATHTLFSFYGLSVAGATQYVAAYTGATVGAAALEEYSGVASVNTALSGNTATGSGTTASITVTIDASNAWVVAFMGAASQTLTTTVGHQRQQVTAGTTRLTLQDNTAASGSVTNTATLSSHAWGCLVIELKPVAAVVNTNQLMMVGMGT